MKAIKVNITLEEPVWQEFRSVVPPRKKSQVINELLKRELVRIAREKQERCLILGFEEAAVDKGRFATIKDWEITDAEGWE